MCSGRIFISGILITKPLPLQGNGDLDRFHSFPRPTPIRPSMKAKGHLH